MKKFLYLVIVALLVIAVPCIAADKVTSLGVPNSSGTGVLEIDTDRIITISSDATFSTVGAKSLSSYERATANDTLTAAESGKTISIYCPAGGCEFELPTAVAGMEFTFSSELQKTFVLDPADTDTFSYGGAAVGDSLTADGNTYNSITILSARANYWTVKTLVGTFNDTD